MKNPGNQFCLAILDLAKFVKFGQISQVGGTVYDNLSPHAGGGVRAQEVEPHTIKPYYLGGISIFRSKKPLF